MNESFTYYRSFYEGLQGLDDATYRRLNDALMRYALFGDEPELTGLEATAFISWKANIDASNRRKANGAKGGRPKTTVIDDESMVSDDESMVYKDKTMVSDEKPNITIKKTETIKDNSKDKKRFMPPTVDDVRSYCKERKNDVDPERFIDFYASKGWKVGNQPMKDWKACVRTWERSSRASPSKTNNKVHFDLERKYDFDDLETKLLQKQKERANEQGSIDGSAD